MRFDPIGRLIGLSPDEVRSINKERARHDLPPASEEELVAWHFSNTPARYEGPAEAKDAAVPE